MPCDCQKWLEAEITRIKYELNGMALIGCKPLWGSLIDRLDQLAADLKTRKQ